MNLIEDWLQIVKSENDKAIVPFLNKLDEHQKAVLLPPLNNTASSYLTNYYPFNNGPDTLLEEPSFAQKKIIHYSILACTQQQHPLHRLLSNALVFHPETVNLIIKQHRPQWLSNYVNNFSNKENIPKHIDYQLIIQLEKDNYIKASDALIARLLPTIIFEEKEIDSPYCYHRPQNLLKHPLTLSKHIWSIFYHPSFIYSCDRWLKIVNPSSYEGKPWFHDLKELAAANKISRLRLLDESLLATKRGFNKLAVSWFVNLWEYLQAQKVEVLNLQPTLFAIFSVPHSKAVNTALKYTKLIAKEEGFQIDLFLEQAVALMTSKTKSVLDNTFSILYILSENYPSKIGKIATLFTLVFANKSVNPQIQAARYLKKYKSHLPADFIQQLLPYHANLLTVSKNILKDIFEENEAVAKLKKRIPVRLTPLLDPENKIDSIDNFEQFIEFSKIALDNKAPYHFDLFFDALLKFQSAINEKNMVALQPMFRKAYKLVFSNLPKKLGMLDNIMAVFLTDFARLLIHKYPNHSSFLSKLEKQYGLMEDSSANDNATFEHSKTRLQQWYNPYDPSQVYLPVKKNLLDLLALIIQEKKLPLLACPTHAPHWVNPIALVHRLAVYQAQNETPLLLDFQMAIARLAFENRAEALQIAKEKLKGSFLEIICFLLDKNQSLPFEFDLSKENLAKGILHLKNRADNDLKYVWLTAVIIKNAHQEYEGLSLLPDFKIPIHYLDGQHDWMVFWEKRRLLEYNYKSQKVEYTGKPFHHAEIQIKFQKGLKIGDNPHFIYQYIPGNEKEFRPNINDVHRLLGLMPNNPEPMLALLLSDNLNFPDYIEEDSRKRVFYALDWFGNLWHKSYGEMGHLFLGTCMVWSDKTIRQKAASIWKKSVSQKRINNARLGTIIGIIEGRDFAPLKRFIDLVQQDMLHTSEQHNQALELLIVNLISKLPAVPIKNTKKLLLIYQELLLSNQSTIPAGRVQTLLGLWQDWPSLKQVIGHLIPLMDK
jgi:hypothetical protein